MKLYPHWTDKLPGLIYYGYHTYGVGYYCCDPITFKITHMWLDPHFTTPQEWDKYREWIKEQGYDPEKSLQRKQ